MTVATLLGLIGEGGSALAALIKLYQALHGAAPTDRLAPEHEAAVLDIQQQLQAAHAAAIQDASVP